MIQKRGWFRYGVSSKERLENLKKAIMHGKPLFVGFDKEYFSMKFRDGEALPVWISRAEAQQAVPQNEFPSLEFVEMSKETFIEKFGSLKNTSGTYIAIRPGANGECLSLSIDNFFKSVLGVNQI